MNSRKITSLSALLCSSLCFLGGCASEPESHLVTAPPPPAPTSNPAAQPVMVAQPQQVMVTQNGQAVVAVAATPATVNSYVVMQAPPAPPAPEAVPARPSSSHVWIAGYWTWRNDRYEWMAGHWEMPPYSGARWINPHSEPEGGAVRFYEGHWG